MTPTLERQAGRGDNRAGAFGRLTGVVEVQRPGLAGHRQQFEWFVADSAAGLLRLATAVSADPSTAQDVVQSVLERAFRDWPRISGLDNPGAYVRRMITNEAVSLRRRAARIALTDAVPERVSTVDEMGRVGEIEELISRLRRLPQRQRAAITLRYLYDLPDAEIARHLGCREVSVRGYVMRGLRTLRVDPDTTSAVEPPPATAASAYLENS